MGKKLWLIILQRNKEIKTWFINLKLNIMNYFYCLLFVILTSSITVFAQIPKKVLFIGNSYTSHHNLPGLVLRIAESAKDEVIIDRNTIGAYTFERHTTNEVTLSKIKQDKWDYVILQEQSQRPSYPIDEVKNSVFPYAAQLTDLIRQSNPQAKPVFYITWGRKDGDTVNCPKYSVLCTYEGMDDLLQERYKTMAVNNKGILAPVGVVWRYLRKNHPEIELYNTDGSHPSLAGSMAAAYTIYVAIFGKDPTKVTYGSSLDKRTADQLKKTVKTIVFNNKKKWFILD